MHANIAVCIQYKVVVPPFKTDFKALDKFIKDKPATVVYKEMMAYGAISRF